LTYKIITDNFIKSPSFSLRMATVKTLAFILYNDIESVDEFAHLRSARRSKRDIFKNLFKDHQIKISVDSMEVDDTDDVEVNTIASSLQLFTSLFCVNFILRKPIILEISKLILRYNFSNEAALKIFEKILAFLKCDAQSLIDSNSIENLLTQWIIYGLNLST
jgi:hypothetical protein